MKDATDNDSIKRHLRQFMAENLIKDRTAPKLQDDDSFFEKEVIDSTGVLELVLFLEETFGFTVQDDEIVPENLDSVNRVVAYVRSKTANPGTQS